MTEMSPLLRVIVMLARVTIMVIAALLVLLSGVFIGLHREGMARDDWAMLIVMLLLTAFAIYLAWALGRELRSSKKN